MSDEQNPAEEVGDEVVSDPPETEGQVETQTEDSAEVKEPDAQEEEKSKSQKRREKKREYVQGLEADLEAAREREARMKAALTAKDPPKEEDFDDYEDFRITKILYNDRKEAAEVEVKKISGEVEQIQRAQAEEIDDLWAAQVQEAQTKYADFERVAMADTLPISPDLAQQLKQSDLGADVLYHLGTHPAQAHRLSKMKPIELARELGRIEARLTSPLPKVETTAPSPIKPVQARGSGVQKSPSEMTMAEYEQWVQKR